MTRRGWLYFILCWIALALVLALMFGLGGAQ